MATNQGSHFQSADLKLELLGEEGCMTWYHVLKTSVFMCASNAGIKQDYGA